MKWLIVLLLWAQLVVLVLIALWVEAIFVKVIGP